MVARANPVVSTSRTAAVPMAAFSLLVGTPLPRRSIRDTVSGQSLKNSFEDLLMDTRVFVTSRKASMKPVGTQLRTMRWSVILPARSTTWAWGRPAGGGRFPPQGLVFDFETTSDQIDSDMP